MTKFFYYLSVESKNSYNGYSRMHDDIIEAESKKDAIEKIKRDYGVDLILQKVARNPKVKPDFKIFITELTAEWEEHWLKVRDCQRCNIKYTLLQSNQNDRNGSYEFCSSNCRNEGKVTYLPWEKKEGIHSPVIYRITYIPTGQCYIGQTTQAFTLRWYQHFFQSTETKFHKFIQESKLTDWTFDVLEVLDRSIPKEEINERERLNILKYDSLENGFNSINFQSPVDESESK